MTLSEPSPADPLTGLLTRKAFEERYQAALDEARRTEQPATLVFFDIDDFLAVNTQFGHLAGDGVLTIIAGLARQVFPEALIGRYGGDEFVILLPSVERETAFLATERLRQAVESQEAYTYQGQSWKIKATISAGLSAFPVDGHSGYELRRKADQALYRAKVAGRNQVRLAYEEKMVPKTVHFTQTQLERLAGLAQERGVTEAELLREALDDLLIKYGVNEIQFRITRA